MKKLFLGLCLSLFSTLAFSQGYASEKSNVAVEKNGTTSISVVGPYSGTPVLGDIIYFNGTNWVSLAKPSDGTYSLKFTSSIPSYQAAGGSTPTGTGFTHITGGSQDAAAKLVDATDFVSTPAAYTFLGNGTSAAAQPTFMNVQTAMTALAQDTSYTFWREDFQNVPPSGTTAGIGRSPTCSGAACAIVGVADGAAARSSYAELQTGTSTGQASWVVADTAQHTNTVLGGGAVTIKFAIRVPVLSTAADEFTVRVGLARDPTTFSNGVYIEYVRATDLHWRFCGAKAAASSCSNTTATVTANQWDYFEIDINAGGTAANLLINGAAQGTNLTGTNIPTAGVEPLATIACSANGGSSTKNLDIDYYMWFQAFSATR